MSEIMLERQPRPIDSSQLIRVGTGLLLTAFVLGVWWVYLAMPTLQTFALSLTNARLFGDAHYAGGANYARLAEERTLRQVRDYTLALLGVRLLVVALAPALLALAFARAGRTVRLTGRLLAAVPLALAGPVFVALGWAFALRPIPDGMGLLNTTGSPLANPARATATLLMADGLATFALACALGTTLALCVIRPVTDTTARRQAWRTFFAVWAIALLATVALTLQSFTLSFLLSEGGPARATTTIALFQYQHAFVSSYTSYAAAVASLTIAVAGLCGLFAWVIVAATGLAIERAPARAMPEQTGVGGLPGSAAGLLVLIMAAGAAALPLLFLTRAATPEIVTRLNEMLSVETVRLNTLLPPAIALAAQVILALMGAVGIGALRPLGQHSIWLLLPFAPWLFIGTGPLSIVLVRNVMDAGKMDTLASLVPPLPLSVPLLFVLTLFFLGRERRRAVDEPWLTTTLLPGLPLALLLGVGLWMAETHTLLWPLAVVFSPELHTMSVAADFLGSRFPSAAGLPAALALQIGAPVAMFCLLLFGMFQVFYLERLAITGATHD